MTTGELVAVLRGLPYASDNDPIVIETRTHDYRVQQVQRLAGVVHVVLVPIDGPQKDTDALAPTMDDPRD